MSTINSYSDAQNYIINTPLKELSVKINEDPQLFYRIMTLFANRFNTPLAYIIPVPQSLILKTLTVWVFREDTDLKHPQCNYLANFIKDLRWETIDVKEKTHEGVTYLHSAAVMGKVDLIAKLLSWRANVNDKTLLNLTPLHYAVWNGCTAAVRKLIKEGAPLDEKNSYGNTPLHLAALNGHTACLKELLLTKKVNVGEKNNEGLTPLHYAVREGRKECIRVLLENGAKIDEKDHNGWTARDYTAFYGQTECFREWPMGLSIEDKCKDNNTLLHLAAWKGHRDFVRYLIKEGAKLNEKNSNGDTPLHMAAYHGKTECLKELLLTKKVNVEETNNQGTTALHAAAQYDESECVELLLKNGAEINAKDNDGCSALYRATASGSKRSLVILLDNNAAREVPDNGNTLLHVAAQFSNDCLQVLLQRGEDVHKRNNYGDTPLHLIHFNTDSDQAVLSLKLLLEQGFDINDTTYTGKTPIYLALESGKTKLACEMFKNGASLFVLSNKRQSPLSICKPDVRAAFLSTLSPLDVELTTLIPHVENDVTEIATIIQSWEERPELVQKAYSTLGLADLLTTPQEYMAYYNALSKPERHAINLRNFENVSKFESLSLGDFKALVPQLGPELWLEKFRGFRKNGAMRKEMLAFSLPEQIESLELQDLLVDEYLTLEGRLKEVQSEIQKTKPLDPSVHDLEIKMNLCSISVPKLKQKAMDIKTDQALRNPKLLEQREAYARREVASKKKERIVELEKLHKLIIEELEALNDENELEIPVEFFDPVYKTLLDPDDCWLDDTVDNKQICCRRAFVNGRSPFTGKTVSFQPAPHEFKEKLRKLHKAKEQGVEALTNALKDLSLNGEQ